ncbi:MAG: hypothetical protein M3512_02430, partial [Bacteroidota bacterium]|nr:hypothetical protein [Bacteroidota bacterium]
MKEGLRSLTILFIVIFIKLSVANEKAYAIIDSIRVNVNWQPVKMHILPVGIENKSLSHEEEFFIDAYPMVPFKKLVFPGVKISDFSISNFVYEDLSEEEVSILQNLKPSSIPKPHVTTMYQSKVPISYIFIPSIFFDTIEHKLKKAVSYTLNYSKEDAEFQSNRRTSSLRNSVLANGEWYKFGVHKAGIYKITYDQLKKTGIPIDDIDPRKLKLYGNGGGMLPQKNSASRHPDLVENGIYISGEEDGKFSKEDYIVFYGQNPDKIKFDATNSFFEYEKNIYSDSTFYFLTYNDNPGLRINSKNSLGESFKPLDFFEDYEVHEKENFNLIQSGRVWLGEVLDPRNPTLELKFNEANIKENTEIHITCSFVNQAYEASSYNIFLNNFEVGSVKLKSIVEGEHLEKGSASLDNFTINSSLIDFSENNLKLNISYNSSTYRGFLDYLLLSVQRKLVMNKPQIFFRSR